MELPDISKINRSRCERWYAGGEGWTAADWSNALAGEVGELCNKVKKVRRHETHVDRIATGQSYNTPPMEELLASIKDEIADVFLYLDLVANHFDLELEDCIFPKFNAVSEIQGFPERLGDGSTEPIRILPGSREAAEYLGTTYWRDSQGNTHWLDGREDARP